MDSDKANKILHALETTEANLAKLERLWSKISAKIPQGISFGASAEYDDLRRQYADVIAVMPAINGFRLSDTTLELNAIAQSRFDANEVGEIEVHVSVEEMIEQPERDIGEYRFRLRKKRRELTRDLIKELVGEFDQVLADLLGSRPPKASDSSTATTEKVDSLRSIVKRLDRVLGSLSNRPPRWGDLQRHLSFGLWGDISDVNRLDWPVVRPGVLASLYGENDPLPVPVSDLDALEVLPPDAPVPTALAFDALKADDFERLVFALVSAEPGYENPQWLMRTNAPDRGRDVSVDRVIVDSLGGTRRERVIVQCKHWRESSVGVSELATLKEQVKLWEPPKVGVLVIATTGRFTADAVLAIDKHNVDGASPRIEMWPDSHMELLLARRPSLVAEFGLRPSP